MFRKAGVEPHPGWTRDDYFKAVKAIHDKTKVPGDTGYFAIMYLYDLYLRQNGKAFFTKFGLGSDRADLTEWWTDGGNRVKAGIVTDPQVVAHGYTESAPWKRGADRTGHPGRGQRGGLGVQQRHHAPRPRGHRGPGSARRQDAVAGGPVSR